jgi:hypothetical protein
MPIKIIQGSHREILGEGLVLLSSPPTPHNRGELYTGEIVEEAAILSKAHGLIENEGKSTSGALLPDVLSEFDVTKSSIVDDFGIKVEVAILGQKDAGIEVQTAEVEDSRAKVIELLKTEFQADFNLKIRVGQNIEQESGPKNLATVHLLLGPEERGLRKDMVVGKIAVLVGLLNAAFGSSESNEGIRGILD